VEVVRLKRRHLVTDVYWPRFTLLGQAFGSVLLMFEAMRKKVPFAMLDTGGYAFGYPVAKAAGCFPMAYVHYPFVSTDMLQRVRDRVVEYNNAAEVASSPLRTRVKLFYYRTLAMLYGFAGRYSSVRRPLFSLSLRLLF
jgi:alpha-1,2-mannosyltransferase